MESFDVDLLREYSERQRKDAERMIALCDALRATAAERDALRAAMANPKGLPPLPESAP